MGHDRHAGNEFYAWWTSRALTSTILRFQLSNPHGLRPAGRRLADARDTYLDTPPAVHVWTGSVPQTGVPHRTPVQGARSLHGFPRSNKNRAAVPWSSGSLSSVPSLLAVPRARPLLAEHHSRGSSIRQPVLDASSGRYLTMWDTRWTRLVSLDDRSAVSYDPDRLLRGGVVRFAGR